MKCNVETLGVCACLVPGHDMGSLCWTLVWDPAYRIGSVVERSLSKGGDCEFEPRACNDRIKPKGYVTHTYNLRIFHGSNLVIRGKIEKS